jgi:Protein of unknown function (DUF3313)
MGGFEQEGSWHRNENSGEETAMQNKRPAMFTGNSGVAGQLWNRRGIRATPHWQFVLVSLLGTCVLVIGFTVRAQEAKPASGFLGDYSKLVPDAKNGDLLLYEKDRSALKKYNKFIFDPITIYLLPEARDRGIDPDDLDRLAKYFHDAVTDELAKSGRYQIVTDPGPDVLELNVAITNVEPTGGKKNAAVKGAVTAATVTTVPGIGLAVPRLSVGKVGIEGEILDSASGERLVAFVTGKGGRRWFAGLNTVKKWGDIEAAFRSWAKDFRARLDEVHGS